MRVCRRRAPQSGHFRWHRESSEFKEIQERVRQIQFADQETAALLKNGREDEKQAALLRQRRKKPPSSKPLNRSEKSGFAIPRTAAQVVMKVNEREYGIESGAIPFPRQKIQSLAGRRPKL